MKALIRRHGYTPTKESQNEVYLEPWLDWIDPTTGDPLTNESYAYALCENVPNEPVPDSEGNDIRLDVTKYDISEHTKQIEEEGETRTVKYWTAVWIGNQS